MTAGTRSRLHSLLREPPGARTTSSDRPYVSPFRRRPAPPRPVAVQKVSVTPPAFEPSNSSASRGRPGRASAGPDRAAVPAPPGPETVPPRPRRPSTGPVDAGAAASHRVSAGAAARRRPGRRTRTHPSQAGQRTDRRHGGGKKPAGHRDRGSRGAWADARTAHRGAGVTLGTASGIPMGRRRAVRSGSGPLGDEGFPAPNLRASQAPRKRRWQRRPPRALGPPRAAAGTGPMDGDAVQSGRAGRWARPAWPSPRHRGMRRGLRPLNRRTPRWSRAARCRGPPAPGPPRRSAGSHGPPLRSGRGG